MEEHIWYWKHAKQLSGIYDETFNKIETYFNSFTLKPKVREECLSEILDLLLHAQKENRSIESLFGEDIEEFCNSYIKSITEKDGICAVCRFIFIYTALILLHLLLTLISISPFSKNFWIEPIDVMSCIGFNFLLVFCIENLDFLVRKKIFKHNHIYGSRYNLIKFITSFIILSIYLTISCFFTEKFMIASGYPFIISVIFLVISGCLLHRLGYRNKGFY